MASQKVRCPKCSIVLTVPDGVKRGVVRCGQCKTPFKFAFPEPTVEDTVADWLTGEGAEPGGEAPEGFDVGGLSDESAPGGESGTRTSPEGCPRLVSIERSGALFEFSTDCLAQERFRLLMPRACIHCGARTHLAAHVLIWSGQLRDSVSLEAEHNAGQLVLDQAATSRLKGRELLAALPEAPGVPAPADKPMPYYVCDLCSGAGWIFGQIQINATTGQGLCRLQVRNLELAREFFLNAGGKDTADDERFQEFMDRIQQNRWDALPSVIRHRLEQWFRPQGEERFIAYVPDRSFARTEDGMNGVVVSDQRLVYHRPPLHYEVPNGTQVNIQVRINDGKEVATIEAQDFKRRIITLDRGGMMLFRRGLLQAKFPATWT